MYVMIASLWRMRLRFNMTLILTVILISSKITVDTCLLYFLRNLVTIIFLCIIEKRTFNGSVFYCNKKYLRSNAMNASSWLRILTTSFSFHEYHDHMSKNQYHRLECRVITWKKWDVTNAIIDICHRFLSTHLKGNELIIDLETKDWMMLFSRK
jgi:hypothetical protein